VFKEPWVRALRERPPWPITRTDNRFLVTMIDPGGAGTSRSAIVTVLREPDGNTVIVGLAEENLVDPFHMPTFIRRYMIHFQRDFHLSQAMHFICVERNYGGPVLTNAFVAAARAVLPELVEHTTDPKVPGCFTGKETNRAGTLSLMWDMYEDRVHFAPSLASSSLEGGDDPESLRLVGEQAKETLLEQLLQVHKEFRPNGTWKFTGKVKGKDGRDDIAMALIMVTYHAICLVSMAVHGYQKGVTAML
jgi:hypothetical protein